LTSNHAFSHRNQASEFVLSLRCSGNKSMETDVYALCGLTGEIKKNGVLLFSQTKEILSTPAFGVFTAFGTGVGGA
jgi:hypothetical protein